MLRIFCLSYVRHKFNHNGVKEDVTECYYAYRGLMYVATSIMSVYLAKIRGNLFVMYNETVNASNLHIYANIMHIS